MTITVELLSADALDLLRNLEKLSILRLKKPQTIPAQKNTITKLYGSLNLNMSVEDIDTQLKTVRDEWERDFS